MAALNDDITSVFRRYYPVAIAFVGRSEVPTPADELFEGYSARFISKAQYREGDFELYLRIAHEGGDTTFAAKQRKAYRSGAVESLVYLADMRGPVLTGRGELRFALHSKRPFFKDKPFVGYTETEEQFRRLGLGIRRLRTMNALAHAFWGLPLHSDTSFCHDQSGQPAKNVWERLVAEGEARCYDEDGRLRFVYA